MIRRTWNTFSFSVGPVALVFAACAAPEEEAAGVSPGAPDPTTVASEAPVALDRGDGWTLASGDHEHFALGWRARSGAVPRNEEFEIEVQLLEDGVPCAGGNLYLRGWMPDHGHGFVREPLVVDLGNGRYLLENVLLHMRGSWQLFFHVDHDGARDVFAFDIEL